MFGRAFAINCPSAFFKEFETARAKQGQFQKFSKIPRVIDPNKHPKQTGGYWLITPNQ